MQYKTPKAKVNPSPTKSPRAAFSPDIFYRDRPSWRIRSMEFVDPFGWHILTREKLFEIKAKLANYETMTWSEILGSHNHLISTADLSQKAQNRLRQLKQDDVDQVLSLRLAGRERVIGIFEGSVMRILWWDPEHQVCLSPKKHT